MYCHFKFFGYNISYFLDNESTIHIAPLIISLAQMIHGTGLKLDE